MTKIIQAKKKISRRLKVNLWGHDNDTYEKRRSAPGQHGAFGGISAFSDYGRQLKAKQMLKGYYAIQEKNLRRVYKEASRKKGDTVANLLTFLERRLDAAVYRLNFVPTIFAARQAISHNHILVNGKKVNIRSYQLRPGDVISLKEKSRGVPLFLESIQKKSRDIPEYFSISEDGFEGTFVREATMAEIPYAVNMLEQAPKVVEYYSR